MARIAGGHLTPIPTGSLKGGFSKNNLPHIWIAHLETGINSGGENLGKISTKIFLCKDICFCMLLAQVAGPVWLWEAPMGVTYVNFYPR